jgi:hypothetical protein
VADDDKAVLAKLAALEAEVKADADAQRARKEAALAKVREQRAKQQAERDELRSRQAALVTKSQAKSKREERAAEEDDEPQSDIGGALELASKANRVKQELARKPQAGEKSWLKSGIASAALGPLGWLYAGSLREAIPASVVWLGVMALASKILPMFLLWPVLFVTLPLSGIAGIVYAVQYNRHGSRQRIFDKGDKGDKPAPKKQLRG